jgi:hypothetical protein
MDLSKQKHARLLTSWGIAIVSALALGGLLFTKLQTPLDTGQQTIISSSTKVVVVVIPGFPLESVFLGILLGFALLHVIRRRADPQL